MSLTGKQRKHLRGLSHTLSPAVHVGKLGFTDAVAAQLEQALDDHELIKIKLQLDREEREEILAELAERFPQTEVVGTIGGVAVLYRPHPDPERRRLELP